MFKASLNTQIVNNHKGNLDILPIGKYYFMIDKPLFLDKINNLTMLILFIELKNPFFMNHRFDLCLLR